MTEVLLTERILEAAAGARGAVILLSPNPIRDTGGGQRSAQIALELLERELCVVFVAHGEVTETVDLGLRVTHPRLIEVPLRQWIDDCQRALSTLLRSTRTVGITQVPVREWLPVLGRIHRGGGVTVFDLIDRWESELGGRWYSPRIERRTARASDVLVASAPALVAHLTALAGRPARLLPNAFNARVFRSGVSHPRPSDLPSVGPVVALYVGSLWGGWMDWSLVHRLATALPELQLVFVGDHRGEGRGLPSNCHFLGLKAQGELPAYLAHAAVGFLPWKVDPVTQATSPLKVYECVAMGLPVIAPVLEPLEGIPGVEGVRGEDAFIAAVDRRAKALVPEELRMAMHAFASRNSWSARVDSLLEITGLASGRPE
ncbi:MAG: glycosyltransferase [Gemmatimonadetes bacterium]|nr:glycosyltransferase [Gemmatimonadota bacterium]